MFVLHYITSIHNPWDILLIPAIYSILSSELPGKVNVIYKRPGKDKEKFRSARKIPPSGKPALRRISIQCKMKFVPLSFKIQTVKAHIQTRRDLATRREFSILIFFYAVFQLFGTLK
jgi:hypothetical protein